MRGAATRIGRAIILLAALTLIAGACGGGKPTIKLYDGQWESLYVNNAIFTFIAEEGYGYPVEIVVTNTIGMQSDLPNGELDLNLEGWQQNIASWYNDQVRRGNIVNLGETYEGGPQFFIIPRSVAEESGIKTVEDMKDHWEVFSDPQDPSKGVFYNCPIGFECTSLNKVKLDAYGLGRYYNLVSPSSNEALAAVLARHQENGQPVFGYHWSPTGLMGAYNWHILEEPAYSEFCRDELSAAANDPTLPPVDQACAYETVPIDKLAHKGLLGKAPELAEMLQKMNVGLDPLNKTLAWAQQAGVDDAETVAVHYLQTYEDRWASWVTAEAYQEIEEALEDFEPPQQ